MSVVRRHTSVVALLLVLGGLVHLPAMATDETTDEATPSTTTVAADPEEGGSVAQPAVTAATVPPDDEEVDWTYRYLIPTSLALAAVVVIVTTVQYFVRVVRKRYKVVE